MRAARTTCFVIVLISLTGCAWIDRASVSSRPGAVEANSASVGQASPASGPSVSQSGRYVAFTSSASNLVPNDENGVEDVFVHDFTTGATELVSIGALGLQGEVASFDPSISDDGRFVAFSSSTGVFTTPPERGQSPRIFVRDRQLRTTTSVSAPGISMPVISGNGRFVAFLDAETPSSSLPIPSGPPYVLDLATRTRKAMPIPGSIDSSWLFDGSRPSLSDDGSRIAYSYIVRPPTGVTPTQVTIVTVVADTATATVIETLRTGLFFIAHPTARIETAISGDGTKVGMLFAEGEFGTLYLDDLAHPGAAPILTDISHPSNLHLSDDGTVIGFRRGSEFVITDANGALPRVVSADNLGHPVVSLAGNTDLSGDGHWVAFASPDAGLVANDTNGVSDIFVRSTGYDGLPPS